MPLLLVCKEGIFVQPLRLLYIGLVSALAQGLRHDQDCWGIVTPSLFLQIILFYKIYQLQSFLLLPSLYDNILLQTFSYQDLLLCKHTPLNTFSSFLSTLEDTARYAGLLLAPAEGFGLRPRLFLPFGQKKSLLCCFGPFLAFFGVQ